MSVGGKLPRWAILALLCLLGVVLMVIHHLFHDADSLLWGWGPVILEVIRDIGIALVVAFLLALTIDRWFAADLNREVFEAVLGYVPPEEFKEEVRSLLRHDLVCESHVMTFTLEQVDGECVRLTTVIERELKNITARSVRMSAMMHMDDWGFSAEKSKIIDCYVEKGGKRIDAKSRPAERWTIKSATDEISIPPKGVVKTVTKCSEIKRPNDEANFNFKYPTRNPEIRVTKASAFEFMPAFGPEEPKIQKSAYGDNYTLVGMYFPGQRMRLRWWPRE